MMHFKADKDFSPSRGDMPMVSIRDALLPMLFHSVSRILFCIYSETCL